MKTLILIIILLLSFENNAQIQEPSAYQKSIIIANLDSTIRYKKVNAILDVYDMYVPEAIPKIEADIFKQQRDIAHWYLLCIEKYGSPNFNNIAHRYIDTVEYLEYPFGTKNINEQKADAITMLMHKGDYSMVGFLFEYIETLKPAVASIPFNVLHLIVENVPAYAEQAKAEFRRIALNINDENYGPVALIFASDYYGDELVPDLVYIIQNSTSSTKKNIAFDELKERNYADMESISKYLFLTEKEITREWLNYILAYYNTPSNYKFILDNYQTVLNPKWISQYKKEFNSTKLKDPIYPPHFALLTDQIEYVKGLCDTLPLYNWLGDNNFSNQLKTTLTTAKTNLLAGDTLLCRNEILSFRNLVDIVFRDSLNSDPKFVTIEGWKFLWWNAKYILDRLPTPKASVKVFLEGPYANGQMMITLNTSGYIPLAQPFNTVPWNYTGTEKVSSIPSNVVDWVLVELRPTLTTRIYRSAAFLKNDGSLVNLDGVSLIEFPNVAAGDYYIVIQHRNHLAVMTSNKITLSLNPALYDMTTDVSKTYTVPNYPSPLKYMNDGKYVMYDGDCNSSGIITIADRNIVVNQITLFAGLMGYFQGDVNLSGNVTIFDRNCVTANHVKFSYVPTITGNNPLNKFINNGGMEISPTIDSAKSLGIAYIVNVQVKNKILSWDIYIKRTQNWSTEALSNVLGISSLCFIIDSEELTNPKIILDNQELLNSSNYKSNTVQVFRNNCIVDLSLKSSDTLKELELNTKTKVLTIQVQISGDEQNVGIFWDKLNTGFSNNKEANIPLQLEDFSKNKLQEQN